MKVGILTGGGDCPGLNAVIRAVVRKGERHHGDEIVGFLDGWKGVIENRSRPLDVCRAEHVTRASRRDPISPGSAGDYNVPLARDGNPRAEGAQENAMNVKNLSLYHFEGCPYCQRVRDAMKRLGVQIELRDIRGSAEHLAALRAATGRQTVPVLRIEEGEGKTRWMPESLDIVAYLEREFARA